MVGHSDPTGFGEDRFDVSMHTLVFVVAGRLASSIHS